MWQDHLDFFVLFIKQEKECLLSQVSQIQVIEEKKTLVERLRMAGWFTSYVDWPPHATLTLNLKLDSSQWPWTQHKIGWARPSYVCMWVHVYTLHLTSQIHVARSFGFFALLKGEKECLLSQVYFHESSPPPQVSQISHWDEDSCERLRWFNLCRLTTPPNATL